MQVQPDVEYHSRSFEWCGAGPSRDDIRRSLANATWSLRSGAARTEAREGLTLRLARSLATTFNVSPERSFDLIAALREGLSRPKGADKVTSWEWSPRRHAAGEVPEDLVSAVKASLARAAMARAIRDVDLRVRRVSASRPDSLLWEWY